MVQVCEAWLHPSSKHTACWWPSSPLRVRGTGWGSLRPRGHHRHQSPHLWSGFLGQSVWLERGAGSRFHQDVSLEGFLIVR